MKQRGPGGRVCPVLGRYALEVRHCQYVPLSSFMIFPTCLSCLVDRLWAAAGAHVPRVGGAAIFGRCPCMVWEPGGHTLAGGRAAPSLPLWPGMAPWLRVPGHAR